MNTLYKKDEIPTYSTVSTRRIGFDVSMLLLLLHLGLGGFIQLLSVHVRAISYTQKKKSFLLQADNSLNSAKLNKQIKWPTSPNCTS